MSALEKERPLAYIPPHNAEAERSVLGSMFLDPKAVFIALERLIPEDFYSVRNRQVFAAMGELSEAGIPVDTVTVVDWLERMGYIDSNDDKDKDEVIYIADLASFVPSASNINHYINIVEQKSVLRALIGAGNEIARSAVESGDLAEMIVDHAGDLIYQIAVKRSRDSLEHIRRGLLEAYKLIGEALKNDRGMLGIPTGFSHLDTMLSGLQGGQLIVVAGRPGMGKTSFALNIAHHIAVKETIPVAIFSLEMSREQLALRLLCSEAHVDNQKTRTGDLSNKDLDDFSAAVDVLEKVPLYIDDSPTITVMEMLAKARRLKQEKGLGLVIIDYLQLMTGKERRENRQQEISGMTRSLKIMAKEIGVPVMILSQLSRASEKRDDKKPLLSDLRESGSIEQDADVVMFIHRENYYNPDADAISQIIVAKQRSGPTGIVNISWKASETQFRDLDYHSDTDAI